MPTSMAAEDLLIHNSGNGQTVEAVGESLPELDVVPPLACKAVGVGLVLPLWEYREHVGLPVSPCVGSCPPSEAHTAAQRPTGPGRAPAAWGQCHGVAWHHAVSILRVHTCRSGCRACIGVWGECETLSVDGAGSTGAVQVGCGYRDGTGAAEGLPLVTAAVDGVGAGQQGDDAG